VLFFSFSLHEHCLQRVSAAVAAANEPLVALLRRTLGGADEFERHGQRLARLCPTLSYTYLDIRWSASATVGRMTRRSYSYLSRHARTAGMLSSRGSKGDGSFHFGSRQASAQE